MRCHATVEIVTAIERRERELRERELRERERES